MFKKTGGRSRGDESVVVLAGRVSTESPAADTESDPECDAGEQAESRPDDGVDGCYRVDPFDDRRVRTVRVVEAREILTWLAPSRLEASRLLHVPSLVSTFRQSTLHHK